MSATDNQNEPPEWFEDLSPAQKKLVIALGIAKAEWDTEGTTVESANWLDIFGGGMPSWKAQHYPEWYKAAYPLMHTYGENLWWESAFIPRAFAPAYMWSAVGRMASSEYYFTQGNRYVNPADLLGQASAAYYRQQAAGAPIFIGYQAAKGLSYAAPKAGLFRGFAFAPMGFAQEVVTGYAQAPYVQALVGAVGAKTAYETAQNYGTLFPFQPMTAEEHHQSALEWTLGQTSLLLLPPLAKGIWAGITQGGLLSAREYAFMGIIAREGMVARSMAGAVTAIDYLDIAGQMGTKGFGLTGQLGMPIRAGQGIGGILRSGWAALGGLRGVAGGVGFGLLQLGAQLTAEELAYIYNMGAAGLGGELYATPERAMRGAGTWGLALGSWGAGAALAAYGAGYAILPAVGGAFVGLAGVAALGMQFAAETTTRWGAGIPWNEPLTYIRGRAFGGEFQVNPRLQGPTPGVGGLNAADYATWFYSRGGVYAAYAYMEQVTLPTYIPARGTMGVGRDIIGTAGIRSTDVGRWTSITSWVEKQDPQLAWSDSTRAYYAAQQKQLDVLFAQERLVSGVWEYALQFSPYRQLDDYSRRYYAGATISPEERAGLNSLFVQAAILKDIRAQLRLEGAALSAQISANTGRPSTPIPSVEVAQRNVIGAQLIRDIPYPTVDRWSGAPSTQIVGQAFRGGQLGYARTGAWISEPTDYVPNPVAVAWQSYLFATAGNYTVTGSPFGEYKQLPYAGGLKTLADAQSYQLYLAGTDSLWLAQNTFRITGGVGAYGVELRPGVEIGRLGSESLARYARSQVWGTTPAQDVTLARSWLDAQLAAGKINKVDYQNAVNALGRQAEYATAWGVNVLGNLVIPPGGIVPGGMSGFAGAVAALEYAGMTIKEQREALGAAYPGLSAAQIEGLMRRGGGCFIVGTLITMGDGSKKLIEQVKVGDEVLAFVPDKPQYRLKAKVTETFKHEAESYLRIRFYAGRDERNVLEVTDEHPIYCSFGHYDQGFLPAKALLSDPSIQILCENQHWSGPDYPNWVAIKKIERCRPRFRKKTMAVYNLHVDHWHTYFANGVGVHNKGAPQTTYPWTWSNAMWQYGQGMGVTMPWGEAVTPPMPPTGAFGYSINKAGISVPNQPNLQNVLWWQKQWLWYYYMNKAAPPPGWRPGREYRSNEPTKPYYPWQIEIQKWGWEAYGVEAGDALTVDQVRDIISQSVSDFMSTGILLPPPFKWDFNLQSQMADQVWPALAARMNDELSR